MVLEDTTLQVEMPRPNPRRRVRLTLAHDNKSSGAADIQLIPRLDPRHFANGFRDDRLAFDGDFGNHAVRPNLL